VFWARPNLANPLRSNTLAFPRRGWIRLTRDDNSVAFTPHVGEWRQSEVRTSDSCSNIAVQHLQAEMGNSQGLNSKKAAIVIVFSFTFLSPFQS
jgi:hypothetical protein